MENPGDLIIKACYGNLHAAVKSGSALSPALLKMGSYSSTMMCQYWDNSLVY